MSPVSTLILVVWVMAALAFAGLWTRVALWRRGAPARVDLGAGLRALPRRYLHDVHAVVARDPAASGMHVAAAGGLVGACALLALGIIPALAEVRFYWAAVALAFALMLLGAMRARRRREPVTPRRLSTGAYRRLPSLLLAFAGSGLALSLDAALGSLLPGWLAWPLAAIALFCGVALARQAVRGPLKHAVAGAAHLACHPRPGRFSGPTARPHARALRPLDLDAPMLGAATIEDFAWNRLAGFDACVECGRCETACPARASGQPLNPKALIQDLAHALDPKAPPYAGSPHPGGPKPNPDTPWLVGAAGRIHPDTLFACTTCRACVEACPMMIEHVDAIIDLRRFQTLELGSAPGKSAEILSASRHVGEPGGNDPARRLDFAAGLDLPIADPARPVDLLLWLGSGAFDPRYGRVLRALVALLHRAGVDFAVLGEAERDSGDLARRLGDEANFQDLARANVVTLARYRFARIVTADPHALHVLRNEYPDFGGHYEVIHHTALLDELAEAGRLPLRAAATGERISYHDPCYLGRYNGEVAAPRRLLDRIGVDRVEMARAGRASFCCGGGGGAPVTDVPGERRIADIRMDEARATGAAILAVACPGCSAMFEGVTGARPEIRDVAELVLEALAPMPEPVA